MTDQEKIDELLKRVAMLEKELQEKEVLHAARHLHNRGIYKDMKQQLDAIESYLTTTSCGSTANRVLVELAQLRKNQQ